MRKIIPKEDKDKIAQMYESGASYSDICKELNVSNNTVINTVKERNIAVRRDFSASKTVSKSHKCNKCKKTFDLAGARFCPFCGSDIRTERQIVSEGLEKVLGIVCDSTVPAEVKDRACNTLRDAIRLLKEDKIE